MNLPPSVIALQPPHVRAALERVGRPAKPARTKPRRKASQPVEAPSVAVVGGVVEVVIGGLRLDVTPNSRAHWSARARKVARQRAVVDAVLAGVTPPRGARYVVRITRRSPGPRMDDDGVVGACKAVRDSIATWLSIDDGSDRVRYTATQERAPWGVRLVVESLSDGVTSAGEGT